MKYSFGNRFQNFLLGRYTRFYGEIFKKSNVDVLIDSSKKPSWIKSAELSLMKTKKYRLFLIYLARDDFAVINSYYRKYPEKDLKTHVFEHKERKSKLSKLYDEWGGEKIEVCYEELASNPSVTIRDIVEFVGLSYDEKMLSFWVKEHHLVNGNLGTRSFVAKYRKKNFVLSDLSENFRKADYYIDHEPAIVLDERWKRELSSSEIKLIRELLNS